jgi:hypothetical protein
MAFFGISDPVASVLLRALPEPADRELTIPLTLMFSLFSTCPLETTTSSDLVAMVMENYLHLYSNSTILFIPHSRLLFVFHSISQSPLTGILRIFRSIVDSCLFALLAALG